MHCQDSAVTGAVAMFVDLTGFTPTGTLLTNPDGGCSMRGAVKKVSSPNATNFSPFLFACLQGEANPGVNDWCYMMGLADADPYQIVIAKGTLVGGLQAAAENLTILQRSSSQYAMSDGLWHHLRLDCLVQPCGDVLLRGYSNDLAAHALSNPAAFAWTEIPGFDAGGYVDDVTAINTGSDPLWGGCLGFGAAFSNALNRRVAFDGLEAFREV
jgi:hypothetical protein